MINLILWLLFGALVGWLASIVMGTDGRQDALLNMVLGCIGALLGGYLFDARTINSGVFELPALMVSFVGTVFLLVIIKALGRITF